MVSGMISGCTTEKNTRASRAYHNLTARYNIYFNGKESLIAGVEQIEKGLEDDFTQILPVYKESSPSAENIARADMDNAILKGSKLVQTHSITKKPKRQRIRTRKYQQFASQEEFNEWIDDSYLLIGKAYFYQHNFASATENFSYLLRKFPEGKAGNEAKVWLIRCYSELDRFPEALEMIQSIQSDKGFPRRLDKEVAKAAADMYLKQKEYRESIKFLEIARDKSRSGREKARLQYITAQLYREIGDESQAIEAFRRVKKHNPSYKMAFNARVNAAGMFSGKGDPAKLKKELQKMLRDNKNTEFKDQIYYALANVYFREGNRTQAIENYRNSVSSSVDNDFQLAQSALTVAGIYFEDKVYPDAQAYYDSAMMVIDEEYPDYDKINIRYTSLSGLIENLTTIEVQDSLQKLALMPEGELNTLIDKWIAAKKEQQRQAELMATGDQYQRGYYRSNEYRFGLGRSDEGGGWYFYNPQTISYGRAQFQQRWGRRKLEDDWRRTNKSIVSMADMEGFTELIDSTKIKPRVEDPLERDFYTQDIPFGDSLMAISHEKIRDALYNAGKIFKSDFSDYIRSAEMFEELNRRYPDNIYLLSNLYDLYDLYELMGDPVRAKEYRDLIINRYPDSKFARYLQNPNYFIELQAQQDSLNRLYQDIFYDYKSGRYTSVIARTAGFKTMEPDSLLLSKIDFMQSVSQGAISDKRNFQTLLEKYLSDYPKAETAPLATEILTLIKDSTLADYRKLVDMGYLHEEIRNTELQAGRQPENDEFGGKYSYDEDLLHYFVIAYSSQAGIDVNRLKFDIANYNLDHYTRLDFDIEEEILDSRTKMLLVRSLENKEQGLIYFRALIRQSEVFRALSNADYVNFMVSSTNYRQILTEKSISDYLLFFIRNYSRFIGPDFEREGGSEESPEELMARAKREDDLLKERGQFVTVDIPGNRGNFSFDIDTTQTFILAIKDKNLSIRTLLTQFADFNRDNFRIWNLALQLKQAGDYQFLVVRGLPGYLEGISYFRKVILERSLFRTLGQTSYRNFLLTDVNLSKLLAGADVDDYLEFFRINYIQKAGQVQEMPGTEVPGTGSQTGSTLAVPPATVAGPYTREQDKDHYVVMVVPVEGVNREALLSGFRGMMDSDYASLSLTLDDKALDGFRNLIRIAGFTESQTAKDFATRMVRQPAILSALGSATYRSFIITPGNFSVFLDRKNITEYLDFQQGTYGF